MGKTQQQRKRKRAAASGQVGASSKKQQHQQPLPSPPSSSSASSSSDAVLPSDHKRLQPEEIDLDEHETDSIDEVDLAITLETLSKFVSNPSLLSNPSMKPIRTALHLLTSTNSTSNLNSSGDGLIATISSCLRNSDWTRALLLLDQVQEAKIVIKLGTLQRWIRDCDSVAAITEDGNGNLGADYKVYIVIDKIMRTINGTSEPISSKSSKDLLKDVLIRHESWCPKITEEERIESRNDLKDLNLVSKEDFRLCQNLLGAERIPPNKFPAKIYTSKLNSIPLTPLNQRSKVISQNVPNVKGAKFLSNVFSKKECETFVRIAEEIGMLPDEPISTTSAANLQSVLAHNFYWLADLKFIETLFERIQPCLPEFMDGGRKLTGINSRFRLYKYTKGSVYRPHIDGAWPPSGLDSSLPEGQDYVYDVSPSTRKEWSRFTLLLYLNEGFKGGATTFFTPNPEKEGVLDAWPVQPVIGCALVFPHGASEGSLVHEGSGIEKDGDAKFIIRTDVLYTRDPVGVEQ